ncbi:MAG TPA: glutamate racemase [Phycisphaerae bacterium]|nr:glutamate racemase [Phycisphaerae bacterium]
MPDYQSIPLLSLSLSCSFSPVREQNNHNRSSQPIGVFDSGLGGLTVVHALNRALPGEDIVYLGDSARVPYGIKSLQTISRFAMEDASFLSRFDPKLIVVACNTASAAAIDQLREKCDVDVMDVISPGAKMATEATAGAIGVIATEATIDSGAYQRAIAEIDPDRQVMAVACPLLVPIVEEGRDIDDPIVLHVLCDYLRDLQRLRPGALILGCTHYPLLSSAIAKLMGPEVTLVNSGAAAALEVQSLLRSNHLLNLKNPADAIGSLQCYTTDKPQRFGRLGRRFGGREIGDVRFVATDELEVRKET